MLDSINTEMDGMAEVVTQEGSAFKDAPLSDEPVYGELDPELFSEEEDFQLDIETTEDPANPSTEIQTREEVAKAEKGTLMDDKSEDEKTPVKKEKRNTDNRAAETTGESTESASILSEKIREDVDRTVDEKITPITIKSNRNTSENRESESEMEGKEEAASQNLEADFSNSDLANLMNSRIEEIVIRTLEEHIPAIVDRSILDAIKRILLAM
jgi:hypothetical protein